MNLTAGLDVLLEQRVNDDDGLAPKIPPIQRRVLHHWTRLDIECGGDGNWLRQAWQMGPNQSKIDLTHIMKCPVHEYEHQYPYPVLHPGLSMPQLIRSEMKQKSKDKKRFVTPRPEDVDDEQWMHQGDEALEKATAKKSAYYVPADHNLTVEELDDVLGGFEKFMAVDSEIEGISHTEPGKEHMSVAPEKSTQHRTARGSDDPFEINPRVFLNLLHEVLKATPKDLALKLTKVSKDPYFSAEDYALMEPDDSSEDESDSRGEPEMDKLMVRCPCFDISLVLFGLQRPLTSL
jgi:hypothetical protein